MKGIRFYLEYDSPQDKRAGNDSGNVIAVKTDDPPHPLSSNLSAMAAVYYHPNSPVMVTGVSPEILRARCKRISESRAREIHPELFKRLDGDA